VRRGNAPEGTHGASDPGVAQLLRLIEGGDKNSARTSGECSTCDGHGAETVGVRLQDNIKVAASRQLPLERANIRCDCIEPHLYPSIAPERW
jgi:hypothetical protein